VAALRANRRLGALFVCAATWIMLIGAAAIFADLLPLHSPNDMDFLGSARCPMPNTGWATTSSGATSSPA
jgi:hypothetical protein